MWKVKQIVAIMEAQKEFQKEKKEGKWHLRAYESKSSP